MEDAVLLRTPRRAGGLVTMQYCLLCKLARRCRRADFAAVF